MENITIYTEVSYRNKRNSKFLLCRQRETVEKKTYDLIREYEGKDLTKVKDPNVKSHFMKYYDENIGEFKKEDIFNEWLEVRKQYAVEPSDDRFWECENQDKESDLMYRFDLSMDYVVYELTPKEKELIYKAIKRGETFSEAEELKGLYKKVLEFAKDELRDILKAKNYKFLAKDFNYEIFFGECPKFKTRYLLTFDEYFKKTYKCSIRFKRYEEGDYDRDF